MRVNASRLAGLSAFLLATTAITSAAYAQATTIPTAPTPPVRSSIDERGVDLISGSFNLSETLLSIGVESSGGMSRTRQGDILSDGYSGSVKANGSVYTVSIGGASETFDYAGGAFTSKQGQGSTLTLSGNIYTYTLSGGTIVQYSTDTGGAQLGTDYSLAQVSSVTTPDGEVTTVNYRIETTYQYFDAIGYIPIPIARIQSVINNAGYQIKYNYASNTLPTLPTQTDIDNWTIVASQQAINNAIEYCAPTADTCSFSQAWPAINISGNTVTDSLGRSTTYAINKAANSTSTITRPSGAATSFTRDSLGRVSSWSNGTGTWSYSYSDSGSTRTTTVTDPLGHTRVVTSNTSLLVVLSERNGLNNTTSYEYDTKGRMTKATQAEGNYETYTYDDRGNLTQTTYTPKVGSGLSAVSITAGYDANCSNPRTCNQPNWTRDALGHQTDYTYDPTHGGVATVTQPAGTSGVRPQVRYTYALTPTYAKNSGGGTVQIGSIWALSGSSACATSASCAGAAEEVKTVIARTASTNLLPTSVTRGSGDGALAATSTITYDNVGNTLTIDGPATGTADTIRYRYDSARQMVGVVGPDPDGGGALHNRAIRTTYDVDGRATIVEQGFVNSQSDADWAAITVFKSDLTKYDSIGRVTHQASLSGGAIQTVVQFSYDAANRATCSATRMNPATFGAWPNFASLPASACTLGAQGADGPDRISYSTYDNADQLLKVTVGYGTTAAHDDGVVTYSANGLAQTTADAKGNLTTYEYDGFDRLAKTRYPNAAGGGSSTSDYAQSFYDVASNVVQERQRDGGVVNYSYDALNRISYSDGPPGWYYYDNLGRPTYTYSGAAADKIVAHYYDGLGRPSYTYDYRGGTWYSTYTGYDAAGRRTMLQWSDGNYVNYDYDAADEMTGIRENGGLQLAAYTYDDLGRRTATYRGNGAQSYYGYDSALRLSTLTLDLASTAQDEVYGFTYSASGQIKTRTSSNDAYRWTSGSSIVRNYAINGLNQATTSGAQSISYDGRGNLSNDGASTYSYDMANRLATSSSGATLTYDPLGRLGRIATSTATQFVYSGTDMIGELDASNGFLRRYVPGPGTDEPLLWYEGAGLTDRRFLLADERGSIVAVTNGSGAATAINTYDEYGVPGVSNQGRYQYTGQTWIPEVGLYNYKARVYSPTIGRFMQPDPLNYGDGANWYAYAGNDPINNVDPSGNFFFFAFLAAAAGSATTVSAVTVTASALTATTIIAATTVTLSAAYLIANSPSLKRPGGNSSTDKACNNRNAVDFAHQHQADAAQIARDLGVSPDYILGLSANESGWGTGRFAVQGNNFFSLHGGSKQPFAIGSILATGTNKASMSTFPSYLASGRSFAAQYGQDVRGARTAQEFVNGLKKRFNKGVPPLGDRQFESKTLGSISMAGRRVKCP